MKKFIFLATLIFATSAFARGDKRLFRVSVTGPTAQAAYDNASALADRVEAAGPSNRDYRALGLPLLHESACTLSSQEIRDRDFLERKANIVDQITYGVSSQTGLASWTAIVRVSCNQ